LFAELGKKIDRIAAYLRTQQCKASMAADEAQRLQQRRRSAEQRVSDVKEMLSYFMRCRNLKRLEGELNTIRLQTNSQPSIQIDDWELPQEFCLHTGSIPHRLLKEVLEHLPIGLKGEFLQAMINTQPNTQLVRDALLRAKPLPEPNRNVDVTSGSTSLAGPEILHSKRGKLYVATYDQSPRAPICPGEVPAPSPLQPGT
jgi:hypothetical protein